MLMTTSRVGVFDATIAAQDITAAGIEFYISAKDAVENQVFRGDKETPMAISVAEPVAVPAAETSATPAGAATALKTADAIGADTVGVRSKVDENPPETVPHRHRAGHIRTDEVAGNDISI